MDESTRLREFGNRIMCHAIEVPVLLSSPDASMRLTDAGPYVVIDVIDKNGKLVAFSETSSAEDVGRDVEEFAFDFFSAEAARAFIEGMTSSSSS